MLIPEVRQARPEPLFAVDVFKERFDTDSTERVFGWEDEFPLPLRFERLTHFARKFFKLDRGQLSSRKLGKYEPFRGLRVRISTVRAHLAYHLRTNRLTANL
jgi:hypothetical protein